MCVGKLEMCFLTYLYTCYIECWVMVYIHALIMELFWLMHASSRIHFWLNTDLLVVQRTIHLMYKY